MDFMLRTLDLLPQPAAVYELGSHEIAVGNNAAVRAAQERFGDDVTRAQARKALGVEDLLDEVAHAPSDTYAYRDLGNGCFLYASVMPADELSRPDLILVSMHCGMSQKMAYLDHRGMKMTLMVNETAQNAIGTLQAMIVQAQGVVMGLEKTLVAFNQQTQEFLAHRD